MAGMLMKHSSIGVPAVSVGNIPPLHGFTWHRELCVCVNSGKNEAREPRDWALAMGAQIMNRLEKSRI